jgi:uncharacterized membrane protein
MPAMSDAIAIQFDDDEDAILALRALRELERAGEISFSDTAVVARDDEGKVWVKNELDSNTETGLTIGALVGALFGPLGLIAGAAGGAAIGSSSGAGVDDDFVEQVERRIEPGRSALFLAIKQANADALVAELRAFRGQVIRSTLTPEAEEVLNLAMSSRVESAPAGATEDVPTS